MRRPEPTPRRPKIVRPSTDERLTLLAHSDQAKSLLDAYESAVREQRVAAADAAAALRALRTIKVPWVVVAHRDARASGLPALSPADAQDRARNLRVQFCRACHRVSK